LYIYHNLDTLKIISGDWRLHYRLAGGRRFVMSYWTGGGSRQV